ncbi:hypothetical protein ACGFNU_17735 [Spirillospora sp. NPDC048911]
MMFGAQRAAAGFPDASAEWVIEDEDGLVERKDTLIDQPKHRPP